jgi:excisionase family DNA binding protein
VNFELPGLEDAIRAIVREELDERLAENGSADEWLSTEQAASYLGLSVGHLHNLKGKVPSHKVGGRRRYRRSELDAWQLQSG